MEPQDGREQWGNRAGFMLATLASAVGLGNIWRFSYVAGENGGAAFLLAYVLCVVAIGLPAMLAELALGARARADVVEAFAPPGVSRAWRGAGALAAFASFAILSYYSVVAGWACRYFAGYLDGSLARLPRDDLAGNFAAFLASPAEPLVWHFIFMAATGAVVAAGVRRGIELAARVLMPLLAVLVLMLAGYALSLGGAAKAFAFLLVPDWSRLADPGLYLAALGQVFFSLGIGMGVLVTYGSYLGHGERLPGAAVTIAVGDTLFALVAGMAIFPAVFAFGLDPAQGPALAFETLPQVFVQMPGGHWFAVAFFFLLVAAALTSAVSLLEVPVAYAMRRSGRGRLTVTVPIALAAALAGIPAALGAGVWRDVRLLGRPPLEAMDHIAADLLLPVVAIALLGFVGWALPRREVVAAAGLRSAGLARSWFGAVRYLAPVAIALMLAATALASQ